MDEFRYENNYLFENYTKFISNNLNLNERISLTIRAKQLFDCKSNIFPNDKCMEYLDIKKNIYANKEFGICFEFIDKNGKFNLKHKDFIEIIIKYKIQRNFLHILLIPEDSRKVILFNTMSYLMYTGYSLYSWNRILIS